MFRTMTGIAAAIAFVTISFNACSKTKDSRKNISVLNVVAAGAFYPANPSELKKEVNAFIENAPQKHFDGEIIGIVAPHAGYKYSGAVAGAAFAQLKGKNFKRVVVIAPSHHVPLYGAALSTKDAYRTPLGDVPIDKEAVESIIKKYPWASDYPKPFESEHALEVELPFLQVVLGEFKLIPIIVGAQGGAVLTDIANALNETFPGGDTLFVASSDLSHYKTYDKAAEADRKTIAFICERDSDEFDKAIANGEAELCGSSPVFILKRIAALRGAELKLVEYKNSGDTAGDRSRVVGYAAIVAVGPKETLGDPQKKELLKLARETVVAHVTKKKLPALPDDPIVKRDGAAFVTLKKHGGLRGCIGQIIAQGPLDRAVRDMAKAAASSDPRFPPVKPDELKDITIEISVLTPPEDLKDPLAVVVGADGLIIEKGFSRGVLLPQVPVEEGWTKDEYLEGICRKAGLFGECWRDAKLQKFQAIVFSE